MRVWREEPKEGLPYPPQPPTPKEIVDKLQELADIPVNQLDLAREILSIPKINAVEITDITGAGEVLYKDWP